MSAKSFKATLVAALLALSLAMGISAPAVISAFSTPTAVLAQESGTTAS